MYLTHLELRIQNPGARQCLANCHDMHRSLMKGFPQYEAGSARANAKMMYRVIANDTGGTVFMQSAEKPNLAQYERLSPDVRQTQDISALQDRLKNHTFWGFELLAIPCKKEAREGRISHRVFLKTGEERLQWLERQAERRGFRIADAYEKSTELINGRKGNDHISADAVVFSGVLEILDSDLFWNSFMEGIGPEKAYGAGMLMITAR